MRGFSTGDKMTKKRRTVITLLSLIGLILAIELCVVYYNANFAHDAKPSICAINDMMDCDGVARTSYSQFLGIPLSLWGVCLYLFFLFMTFTDKLKNIKYLGFLKIFKNPMSYIFCISLLSFIISMILGGISVFKINAICIFCFMTYFIDLLIALSSKTKGISVTEEIKISFNDFLEAVKIKKYAYLLIVLILASISVLTYTTVSNVFSPQIAKQQELKRSFKLDGIKADKNTLGNENASLQIDEYMDYNCGGCFIAQVYLHRIVSEFENIRIIQHNVPLDASCNSNIKDGGGHKNSCLKARYALAAAKQNKYWHLGQALFNSDVENEKDIIEAARLLDIDVKKLKDDANSEAVKKELADSIKNADSKGVTGTPTLFIGVKQMVGVGTYPEFVKAIIAQGGIKKPENEK